VPIARVLKIIARTLVGCLIGVGSLLALGLIYLIPFAEVGHDPGRSKWVLCRVQIDRLHEALEKFHADCGRYPNASEGLEALVVDGSVPGWHGPYREQILPDPWGRPYLYLPSADSSGALVVSYGADGRPGGALFDSDLSSLEPSKTIPASPYEIRLHCAFIGVWFLAWLYLAGCVYLLRRL
jgi:general secretion pathway protein G